MKTSLVCDLDLRLGNPETVQVHSCGEINQKNALTHCCSEMKWWNHLRQSFSIGLRNALAAKHLKKLLQQISAE